jgi:tyrosinase
MGFTRRSLLKRSSIALAASSLPPWLSGPLLAQVANPLVRHDVNGTTADAKAAVAAYRKGVGVMKLRKSHDPTSWLFQANIHAWPGKFGATASDPEQEFKDVFSPQNTQGLSAAEKARREQLARAVWGTCMHGDPAERFLPWHRVYLFFFERLIRAAAGLDGSSSAGLPYWNWTKDRTLPLPLREAVNGNQDNNSLYWNNRRVPVTRINNPESIAADSVAVSAILDLPDFSPTFDPNADLGFSNQLEQGPHGDVHVWIQTPPRGMGFFEEAARDPAFWLHHANLDRLWAHWRKNAAHKDPVDAQVNANTKWGDLPQTFVDIDGQPKTLTAKQVLIAAQILDQGYVYDDLPAQPPVPGPVAQAQGQGPAAGPGPSSGAAQPARVIASTGPVTISARTKVDLKATASGPGPNVALATTAVPNVLGSKLINLSGSTIRY